MKPMFRDKHKNYLNNDVLFGIFVFVLFGRVGYRGDVMHDNSNIDVHM